MVFSRHPASWQRLDGPRGVWPLSCSPSDLDIPMANVESEVEWSVRCCRMAPRHSGFSLIEVVLVVAILGILAGLATPLFLTYYQGAQLRVAAEEVVTFLNHGRQLGIKEN